MAPTSDPYPYLRINHNILFLYPKLSASQYFTQVNIFLLAQKIPTWHNLCLLNLRGCRPIPPPPPSSPHTHPITQPPKPTNPKNPKNPKSSSDLPNTEHVGNPDSSDNPKNPKKPQNPRDTNAPATPPPDPPPFPLLFARGKSSLTSLKVGWGFDSKTLNFLSHSLSCLRYLSVGVGGSLRDEDLKVVGRECRGLEKLSLYFQVTFWVFFWGFSRWDLCFYLE